MIAANCNFHLTKFFLEFDSKPGSIKAHYGNRKRITMSHNGSLLILRNSSCWSVVKSCKLKMKNTYLRNVYSVGQLEM